MRRITRIDRSIDLLRTRYISQNPYAYSCSACRNQTSPFSTSLRGADKESFAQRVRRSLFKQAPSTTSDPYTGASQLPEEKQEVEREEIIAPEDALDYEQAENGEELEMIGGYDRSFSEELDSRYPYKLFVPKEKIKNAAEATAALHRAIVEVFALRQAGRPLSEISQTTPGRDVTETVQINPSESGVTLQFLENGSLDQIIQSLAPGRKPSRKQRRKARLAATSLIDETAEKGLPTQSEEDVAADRSPLDPLHQGPTPKIDETVEKGNPTESEEDIAADRSSIDPLKIKAETLVASWGSSWLQTSLADPAVKFAVVKRTMQLTGIRIPDNAINYSNTAETLLEHLVTPPKPPTLNKALQHEELLSLPNISVFGNRITPIDRERRIGRLEAIRQEFKARGLTESYPSAWTGRTRNDKEKPV